MRFRADGFWANLRLPSDRGKERPAAKGPKPNEVRPLTATTGRRGHPQPATRENIEMAAAILRAGGLVALPTETVYGLAADATNGEAVARIFQVKGRPRFNPLICHVTDGEAARRVVDVPLAAEELIEAFWPGPLTLVLPRLPDAPISDLVTAGLDTLAVRAPAHSVARQLLYAVDRPLAAPSANPSGTVSPTTAGHVADGLGDRVDLILDGGPCGIGLESTIVAVTDDTLVLLRPGSITQADLHEATGAPVRAHDGDVINAPGQLKSHYAPRARLRLNATERQNDEVLIGFGDVDGDLNLSPAGGVVEAASRLFRYLREADAMGRGTIAVAPIPDRGVGIAINDRLQRAAAPREG